MAASVTVTDLVDEARYSKNKSGVTVTRKLLIEGLDEVPSKRLWQAATLPAVPQFGTGHPTLSNLVVENVDVSIVSGSNDAAHAVVTYTTPTSDNNQPSETATPTTEFGASLSTIETSEDKDGVQMVLTDTRLGSQPVKVSLQIPSVYVRFGRREPSPFNTSKVTNNVGRVNSVTWFGNAPRTWLCTNIRADFKGDAFDVSYEFQFKSDTWDALVVFNDPVTNAPVLNPVDNQSRKRFQIYKTADFNALGLGV